MNIKRTMIQKAITAAIAIAALTALPGCAKFTTQAEEAPVAAAFVIGNHAFSKAINWNNDYITNSVYTLAEHSGYISVIDCDGNPSVLFQGSFGVSEEYAGAAPSKLKADAIEAAKATISEMTRVKANDPEVDTLSAIRMAVRSFDGLPEGTVKTIIVIDTGLSTAGVLDFRKNILSADPKTVTDQLAERNEIPDLTGITVIWIQMGDTELPQKSLSEKQKTRLVELWEGIIERGGGTFKLSNANYGERTDTDYPSVSEVDLPDELPIEFDPEEISADDSTLFQAPQFLSESKVGFIPDSDKYLNPEEAEAVISPIADYLKEHHEVNLVLAGTAAGDNNTEFAVDLSYRRAMTVKNTLCSMGVEEERLTVKGLGVKDPWHVYGVGTKGELAVQNRKVVLIENEAAIRLGIIPEEKKGGD